MEKITHPEEEIVNKEKTQAEGMSRREFIEFTAIIITGSILAGDFKKASEATEQLLAEKREGGPKISFEFYFSPHGTASDLGELPEKIRTADIFIPEMPGWDENLARNLSAISAGTETPDDYFSGKPKQNRKTFERSLVEAIFNSGVKLEFLDLPANSPLLSDMSMNFWGILNLDPEKNIDFHLRNIRERAKTFAQHQVEREKVILAGLLKLKERIENETLPELKDKDAVKVLISIGSLHTSLYHKLSATESSTSRSFSQMPYIYNYFAEMSRRYMLGLNIDDDLAFHTLLEIASLDAFYRILPSDNTFLKNLYVRKLFDSMSREDAQTLLSSIIKDGFDTGIIVSIVKNFLENKKIIVPSTEADLKTSIKLMPV